MIDRLSNRTALAIGVVGLLAVVLVGWFAVVSPQRSKASELDAKITESQTALALAESLNRADARRASSVEARALVEGDAGRDPDVRDPPPAVLGREKDARSREQRDAAGSRAALRL